MYSIPPTPLIKVASDAKPYSKLEPTTLNAGKGGCVYFLDNNIVIVTNSFLLGGLFFKWECLNNFAAGCSMFSQVYCYMYFLIFCLTYFICRKLHVSDV